MFAVCGAACVSPKNEPKEPLGKMPEVATTADPEWIPWSIRAGKPVEADPREKHLSELRQLTFGGENAEAYFSADGKKVVFQATPRGAACDQIFVMDLGSGAVSQVSSGGGKTTCSYFYPAGDRLLYSSTRNQGEACPAKPDRSKGYVWPLDEYDIFSAKVDGSDTRHLLGGPGYDAETTVAPDGSKLIFTSTRDGDLELYTAKLDGTSVKRVTFAPGYDGGAFFSPDSSKIVWRASRPTGPELDDYRSLLLQKLVRPGKLEIWTAGSDGQNARQVTKHGHASFAPTFLPDSRRIMFASDMDAGPPSRGKPPNFDLYMVDPEGPVTTTGGPTVERITFAEEFDSFPMFSPDGKYIVFASNRMGEQPGDTNVFIARWVP
ncbi:MAG: PD40 domain-containing protein [Polyangiaceae bacterium]|nr:PD40 domain-containing protein [Polyangiaceae bacterium]